MLLDLWCIGSIPTTKSEGRVEAGSFADADAKTKELRLRPNVSNHARGFRLENLEHEDMELNVFYNSQQMAEMGYAKDAK